MAKLAKMPAKAPSGPIRTTSMTSDTFTREGAPGFTRDSKSELFLLAVTNLVSEGTFYESAQKRDDRFAGLVRTVAAEDPDWTLAFITYLRGDGNMRTASVVAAVEAGDILAGTTYPRRIMAAALQRADEPGEAVGFWLATRGRKFPTWLKRALGDAAARLYNPYSSLKYDTTSAPVRFADVIAISDHRNIDVDHNLFDWLLARRHGHDSEQEPSMVQHRRMMDRRPADQRAALLTAEDVKAGGYTWETIASYLAGPWTAAAWEAVIPSMGYMALLRNLRNFDEAGISRDAANHVAATLSAPSQVAKSRQLPMRFLSAYNAITNDRWKVALSDALELSLGNVPKLDGDTLVLIDVSGSMNDTFSKDGTLKRWDAAAVFGIAFALANGLQSVFGYDNTIREMDIPKGASLLNLVDRFKRDYFTGGGTETGGAIDIAHRERPGAKRLLVLTDEQASGGRYGYFGGYARQGTFPVADALKRFGGTSFIFNLAGYAEGMTSSGEKNYTIGGLSDAAFRTMAILDRGRDAGWPWEVSK